MSEINSAVAPRVARPPREWEMQTVVLLAAAAGVIFRVRDMVPRPSTIPLPPVARHRPPVSGPADEDFWRRVAALATGRRAEIAVLETTDGLARRWLLVPESGDLAVVRSTVVPGAVLAAFPEPPDASETEGFKPLPADEYHGFLEDAESGAVWYQPVKPNRVGAFLARAHRARRWALYPADSPEALTAAVPPGR